MQIILAILVFAVAAEHIFIMLLEMFFIKSSTARKTFSLSSEFVEKKEAGIMFANQGLYNGFLAAGLLWSFFAPQGMTIPLRFFFLGCVITAAIYGSFTSNKKIIIKQGGLAILAMSMLIVSISILKS